MIEVYTDGGCSRNGAKDAIGAIGIVVVKEDQEIFAHTESFIGTTNNRMEYRALILAMKMCIKNNLHNVKFHTDSNLLVETINKWMYGWHKNGWKKSASPRQIKNLDLVLQIFELKPQLQNPKFIWVKGHADNVWNNRADELATEFDTRNAQQDTIDYEILDKHNVKSNLAL
jgi:ribonuclease HI